MFEFSRQCLTREKSSEVTSSDFENSQVYADPDPDPHPTFHADADPNPKSF